jgi:hypothetical protein
MRRLIMSLAVTCFTTLLLVCSASAQQAATTNVPNLIRYGGVLKDAQGAPRSSTTMGITFAIYKQQDGGAPIWMETQNVATDASGNYSALLGSTTANGLPGDLFSQEEQRWLTIQVEGQAEQPRVLLVSVPYAFKAHEAETLGGKTVSDFVLANGTNSSANGSSTTQAGSSSANALPAIGGARKGAASAGPTNFSGSTTDQIVGVTQSGTGTGVIASAPSKALVGTATSTSGTAIGVEGGSNGPGGYGVYGNVTSATGATVGVKGNSQSSAGTGVRGTNIATTGATTGVSGYVASAAGVAGAFNNAAGGMILSGQNNGVVKFSVDGSGNVNSASGTYQIGGSTVLNIGNLADSNVFLGVGAGFHNVAGSGMYNTFSGYQAGYSNTSATGNTFSGWQAGFSNTTGSSNTFSGAQAGVSNTTGSGNTFYGVATGTSNTTGGGNTFSGIQAGASNTTGSNNTFVGFDAGLDNATGGDNTFSGDGSGLMNTTGTQNTFFGYQAGFFNTTGSSDIYIGNQGSTSGAESNTIRIGTPGTGAGQQSATYIAGLYGATTNAGSAVFVDSTGKLGTSGNTVTGLTMTSVFQNYAGSVDISCPNNYSAVLASCQAGVNVVLNDINTILPPGASSWADYLTPSVNNATGVHCDLGAGNQSQAQLRCAQQ